MKIISNVRPEEVNQRARHVLYVEGSSDGLDPLVLANLLQDTSVKIQALGPCYSVRSVAEALYKEHPTYYFLIDRDHQSDTDVEASWQRFPDSSTNNLLIWRKKELESYFLDPEYLSRSKFIKCKRDEIAKEVLQFQEKRLYIDAANKTIIALREDLKQKWVSIFTDPSKFPDKPSALNQLKNLKEIRDKLAKVTSDFSHANIDLVFEKHLKYHSGGKEPLEIGRGEWLNAMAAKPAFHHLISKCFDVRDATNTRLEGRDAEYEVVKELLQVNEAHLPKDFRELRILIKSKLG